MTEAILTNKRKHPNEPHFIVDVTCPECGHCRTLGVEGWDAVLCGGCGAELNRKEVKDVG
jgi:ribosomal protein S27E